jgi:hypothetical protein
MNSSSFFPRFSCVFVLLWTALPIYAQKFTTFDIPNSTYTAVTAITPSGDVIGYFGAVTPPGAYAVSGFVRKADGTVTVIDARNELQRITVLNAVNPSGQIVGYSRPDLEPQLMLAFIRDINGKITWFGPPAADQTDPEAINPQGEVVGSWMGFSPDIQGLAQHGFVRKADGTITSVDVCSQGIPGTSIVAINPRGQSTGYCYQMDQGERGFLRDSEGSITMIDVLNATDTLPVAINARGQIAGNYFNTNLDVPERCFLRDADGEITKFDVPGAGETLAVAIGSQGQIIGYFYDSTFAIHGFLRESDGSITVLNVPNAKHTMPTAMNARGEIAGVYQDSNGEHGFVMTLN